MTAMALTIGEQVRVRFVGWPEGHPKAGLPLELSWNSRVFRAEQGQSMWVPFELAKLYFGDPRSGEQTLRVKDEYGNDMIIAPRLTEAVRLANFWMPSEFGTNRAKFREFIPGDRTHFQDGISDMLPIVEVYSMDDQRIPMVTDDPFGDERVAVQLTRGELDTQRQQLADQSGMIEQLKKQNAELMARLGLGPEQPKRRGRPPKKAVGGTEAPVAGTVEETPPMVFDPRSQEVRRASAPVVDPKTLGDLPVDSD